MLLQWSKEEERKVGSDQDVSSLLPFKALSTIKPSLWVRCQEPQQKQHEKNSHPCLVFHFSVDQWRPFRRPGPFSTEKKMSWWRDFKVTRGFWVRSWNKRIRYQKKKNFRQCTSNNQLEGSDPGRSASFPSNPYTAGCRLCLCVAREWLGLSAPDCPSSFVY